MLKIFKYTFFDLIRNRWLIIYTAFYLALTVGLLFLTTDITKVIVSISNVTLILAPLIGILYGIMYYYSSIDFLTFLLAQPLSRRTIFTGFSLGIAVSLSLSLFVGLGLPILLSGMLDASHVFIFFLVLAMSILLTIIFAFFSFVIGLRNSNRIKGFGLAIFLWLFFAVIYDGLFLLLLLFFKDYPLEKLTIGLTFANPIDLARILVLMNLDISAMMGYTGAVLEAFLGKAKGTIIIGCVLALWVAVPYLRALSLASKKDF
ncbi:MAG: ABC transporter permease [Saprospiraceae bacterium]|nr:ABC transporter permease [Saprospiraceae bacterium]